MKKILSSLLILGLLCSNMTSLFADDTYSQYLPRVQSVIENMTPSELIDFQQKVATHIRENDNEEIKEFLRTILLLTARDEADQTTQSVDEVELTVQNPDIETTPTYTELTPGEIRTVASEITKLQSNLESETQSLLSQIVRSWNSLTRYTERGSVTAEMDMNIENFGSFQAGMDIGEYIAENQVLDSKISADIRGFYNIDSDFTGKIDIDGASNIELIQKGASTYLLLKDTQFSSSDESIEIELTPMLDKLSELASTNTYIDFSSQSGYDPYEILGYFGQENIASQVNVFFSENLMEAYGKNENGYLLRPTKHFCDTGKELTNVFDPFNGKECSEKQYQNMLEDFMDSGVEITLSTDNHTRLSITNMSDVNAFEIIDVELVWKNASFHEMSMSVRDSFDDTQYVSAHYIVNDMLKIRVPEQAYDAGFMLDMDFGITGNIKTIDVESNYQDEVVFIGNYDNGLLTTSLEIDTRDMQGSCDFSGNAYKNYLKIDGGCDISSPLLGTDENILRIDSSLLYNAADSRNDLNWSFAAVSDEKNNLRFDIQSTAKRTSAGTYEIQAPKSTINYLDFLKEVSPENSYYYGDYEADYEYEYNSYDDYDEACYVYDSGDKTCYEYYDDKDITCNYIAETDEETCETYEYEDYDYYYDEAEDTMEE